ncbi:MAG TPA: chemotaxis protein CheA [Polyangiaceae bacterium]
MSASDTDEIVKEFLLESHENLDSLEQDLVGLESEADAAPRIARIFRTIHTVKGTCGFLGFAKLEQLTHTAESLLSRLRDKQLAPNPDIADALLGTVDAVRAMLQAIEATGNDGDSDYTELVARLAALQTAAAPIAAAPVASAAVVSAPVVATQPPAPAGASIKPAATRGPDFVIAPPKRPAPVDDAASDSESAGRAEPRRQVPLGELLVAKGYATPSAVQRALEAQGRGDPRHVGEILVAEGVIAPADVVDALKAQQHSRGAVTDSTIRVDVGLVDKLLNLVGELVLARNQILQFGATQTDNAFAATLQRLNLVTSELQESVMKTRMQPIDTVWAKLPRIVRDLAQSCGKQVTMELEGKDTELDRTLIEAIKDPLTHLVRNAIDHGIESPERRIAFGKSPHGTIRLRAFHEGGRVNIEISDDGAGIDASKIARRAIESRMVSHEELSRMSDTEVLALVFRAGFTTAERVTAISGRGVGMDVVKTNIERIGGSVDLESVRGKGCLFKLKIPLTLAIVPALLVGSRGDRYAIPQVNLVELVYLEGDRAKQAIELIHGAPVYRLRGNLVPIVSLAHELSGSAQRFVMPAEKDALNLVIVQADDQQFGLIVDEIHDTEEIVVKPLGKHFKAINAYSGATILGDGRVALILDVIGLAQRSGVLAKRGASSRTLHTAVTADGGGLEKQESWLLVSSGKGRTLGIALSFVSRLEELQRSRIERAGARRVVQYRGQILPLVQLDAPGERPQTDETSATQPVVVFSRGDQSVGLMVDGILDIVEEAVSPNRALQRPGISGSAIMQGRVVELVDVDALMQDLAPAEAARQEVYA